MARVDQISKVGNRSGKMTLTREQRPIFKGNEGTWTSPPGDPQLSANTKDHVRIFANSSL